MDKVRRNGCVAVLYSPGFGAGWSTWNQEYPDMIFDPGLVSLVEQRRREEALTYARLKWPDAYLGGLDDLTIEWVPEGLAFRINDYDGNEEVEIRDQTIWFTA